jgi:hypothetical protein
MRERTAKIQVPISPTGDIYGTTIELMELGELKGGKNMKTTKKAVCTKASHKMLGTQLIAGVFATYLLFGTPSWWRILAGAVFWLVVAAAECQAQD